MKYTKRTIQTAAATSAVFLLLLSGAVFAYTTRAPAANIPSNVPSPLDEGGNAGHEDHGNHQDNETQSGTTTTDTETPDVSNNENHGEGNNMTQDELKFNVVPVGGAQGKGQANIHISGTTLDINVEIERAGGSTQYSIVLVAVPASSSTSSTITFTTTVSGSTTLSTTTFTTSSTTTLSGLCSGSLGILVTNHEGDGEAHLQTTLNPGTYDIGILMCDGSNNSPSLTSDPATRQATLTQSTASASTSEDQKGNQKVNAIPETDNDKRDIKNAIDSKTIPASVIVSGSGATASVLDPRFSVSVENQQSNGLLISISAQNVTGPRVLLVNLTKGSSLDLISSGEVRVTLDGNPIAQAASVIQVLNAQSGDPARYIIADSSSGLQLLISIPHFSMHTILLAPVQAQSPYVADPTLLVLAALAVTGVAAAYGIRRRIYSPRVGSSHSFS